MKKLTFEHVPSTKSSLYIPTVCLENLINLTYLITFAYSTFLTFLFNVCATIVLKKKNIS